MSEKNGEVGKDITIHWGKIQKYKNTTTLCFSEVNVHYKCSL